MSNFPNVLAWHFVQRVLRILIPLILVLALGLWWLYHTEVNALLTITRADERHAIQLAKQIIDAKLDILRGDALYLAEKTSLLKWLETGSAAERTRLGADFLAFAQHRGIYDQIRFLDAQGHEALRIDSDQDKPRIVPAAELLDKSGRYYIKDIRALDQGAIYVSPFDLNVKKNSIEEPIKPIIRLGTPVFDHKGHKRGMLLLNYRGQQLLDRLREIHNNPDDNRLWLLNAEGYWLLGRRPEMEWGFMYPERRVMRFATEYAEVWSSIQSGSQYDQVQGKEGLFTYARIMLTPSTGTSGEQWSLVSHVSAATLTATVADRARGFVLIFMVVAVLLTVISGVVAYNGTQRRRSEAQLRENETRFRGLLNSAPDAIVIVDQAGKINLVNSQTEKWFGYSRDELLGQPVERLIPERFHQTHVNNRQRYTATPVAGRMSAAGNLFGVRKDDTEFPVEVSLSSLETEQGLLITSIIRDITTRKQSEEAQRQVQARYQDLVNNLPVGVYRNTIDIGGCFVEVNPTMATIFEAASIKDLLSHSLGELYCDTNEYKAFSDKVVRNNYVIGEEVQLKTLQGREFTAAITAVVKQDATNTMYFDGIIEDITVRKENERHIRHLNDSLRARSAELETINRELEAFSYSVSHDLRAPLRAIDGFSSTLLKDYADELDDKGKDRLNRVRSATQRMALLIDDLLKLSRVSRAEIKWESIDLGKITSAVMEELRQIDAQRNVQISIQADLFIQGDTRLLRIVMDNLLGNAWKFTGLAPNALIEVGSTTHGSEVVYFVRDNGAGFDMAYTNKLFGAFQRLHDNSEFPGNGIGLATVQRIIHKHGGRIWAESAVGKGATFYFTLAQGENK